MITSLIGLSESRFLLNYTCGSAGKECLQCRGPGFHPWVGKTPWRRERLPTPVFWPGEFHGLYGPWGRKESDITLTLTFSDRYNEIEVTV